MPIVIQCPRCSKSYSLKDDLAGKPVKCKCGQSFQVPDSAESSDPMEALLNDALPTPEVPGSARRPLKAGGELSGDSAPAKTKRKKRKKTTAEAGDLPLMTRALMGVGMMVGLLLIVAIIALVVMHTLRPGYPTPEETFAAHQEALYDGNWNSLIRTYSPESQEKLVGGMLAFASMLESSTFVKGALKKHGVDGLLEKRDESAGGSGQASEGDADGAASDGEEDSSEEEEIEVVSRDWEALAREAEERRQKAVAAIEDKVMFYVDFMAALDAEQEKQLPNNPVLKLNARKAVRNARRVLAEATLDKVKVDGDTAAGEVTFKFPGKDDEIVVPVAFKENGGRWLIHFPNDEDEDNSPMRSSLIGSNKFGFLDRML